ncbi:MAG: mechanosensitive ion channel [Tissierellia bacterium]|nr:mechanosensitive ion channel [Tissierellia bacterium]
MPNNYSNLIDTIKEIENNSNKVVNNPSGFFQSIDWSYLLLKTIGLVIILAIGITFIKFLRIVIKKFLQRHDSTKAVRYLVDQVIKIFLYLTLFLIVMGYLGIKTTSFVALIASLGVGVGLALQGSLSDLASGVLIIITRPFQFGDIVYIDTIEGARLKVQRIGFFDTRFSTVDGFIEIIPNRELMQSRIINISKNEWIQLNIVIGIGYSDDIDKARELVLDELSKIKKINQDMNKNVFIKELNDSSVDLLIKAFVKPEDNLKVSFEVKENVKKRFDKENIEIPFPQLDIHNR